jgi:hypothetical protein
VGRIATLNAQNVVVHTTVHSGGLATTILAALGVLLALASLGWQAVSFRLSGSRVTVVIRAGATDGLQVATMPGSPAESEVAMLAGQGLTQRILAVEVANSGRAPTSVTSVELRFTNGGGLGGPRRGSPELPCRMDPEEDLVVRRDRGRADRRSIRTAMKTGRPWTVLGVAKVAGRKGPVTSQNEIRVL